MKMDNYIHNARYVQYHANRIIQHVASRCTDYATLAHLVSVVGSIAFVGGSL